MTASAESRKFGVEWVTLDELWSQADYITLHTPLIAQTRRESRRLYTVLSNTAHAQRHQLGGDGDAFPRYFTWDTNEEIPYLTFVPLYTAEIRRNNGFLGKCYK